MLGDKGVVGTTPSWLFLSLLPWPGSVLGLQKSEFIGDPGRSGVTMAGE